MLKKIANKIFEASKSPRQYLKISNYFIEQPRTNKVNDYATKITGIVSNETVKSRDMHAYFDIAIKCYIFAEMKLVSTAYLSQ